MTRSRWMLSALLLAGCGGSGDTGRDTGRIVADTTHAESTTAAGPARVDAPERAARRVIALLRGTLPLDSVSTADTVVLRVAPEGGGHEARVPRTALRDPAAWAIPTGRARQSLVPPAEYTQLTTRPGRHFNCTESGLDTRAPAWAAMPHVGVRLTPPGTPESCLRTWNATFVFDTTTRGAEPRLIGVLYDQWEW